jgi:hypothetical protein
MKRGRPLIGDKAMTANERQARSRAAKRLKRAPVDDATVWRRMLGQEAWLAEVARRPRKVALIPRSSRSAPR